MKIIRVTNMTSLFSKEMLIYSFFDIRLKSPLRVIGLLYFILLFFLISVPIMIITWPINAYSLVLVVGIPFGGATLMSKPIWNGKSFISFAKTQIKYFSRPKILYDWKAKSKNNVYMIENEMTVSRHEDYNKLYKMVKNKEEYNV